jgi:hypothetical protein
LRRFCKLPLGEKGSALLIKFQRSQRKGRDADTDCHLSPYYGLTIFAGILRLFNQTQMKRLMLATLMVATALPAIAADDMAGEYAAHVTEVASGLMLHPNQTYEFYFVYGAADYMSKGSWRRDKDSVVLTSSAAEAKPFRVVRTGAGTSGAPRVYVLAPNGRGVQHMDVMLTTSTSSDKTRTSEEGLAEFELKGPVKSVSVHVPVYDVDAGPFDIAPGSNDIWLEINGDAITNLPFKDERLKLVNGALELTYWKGDKPLRYEKRKK